MARAGRQIAAQREQTAWHYRQQGWSEARIAENLNITESGVCRILKRVLKRVRVNTEEQVQEYVTLQLAQLNYIIDEALEAWRKSKEQRRIVGRRTRKKTAPEGEAAPETEDTSLRTEQRTGTPAFLEVAMRAMADIRGLLDLTPATKITMATVRQTARKVAEEVGCTEDEVLEEAERILREAGMA